MEVYDPNNPLRALPKPPAELDSYNPNTRTTFAGTDSKTRIQQEIDAATD